MTEILVLVDHVDGAVRKPTLEMLTLARRLGEPSAVFIGADASPAAETLKQYGAEKIYAVNDADIKDYLVAPKAEVLAQLVEKTQPAAVLITSSAEGKEIGARLAVKTDSGIITDAVDVQAGPVATQSVFAGSYTVTGKVTKGTPIITVKPNAATPEQSDGAGAVEEFAATVSDGAKTARITASEPRQSTGRPELTEAAIVVSGGRGTGGNFEPIENFADSLGAAVGATPRGGGLRLDAAQLPGGPDRQDRLSAALRRERHLRCHPAPRRHADLEDDRRGQQGRRGADLRARRLRRRRRPAHRAARRDRGGQQAQGLSGPSRGE